jgi:Mg2+ and Co2+ transporter CorA
MTIRSPEVPPVAVVEGAVRVKLFDADGHDSELDPSDIDLMALGERHLLWVDIDLDREGPIDVAYQRLGLTPRDQQRLESDVGRARLDHRTDRLHLTLEALEPEGGSLDEARDVRLVRREIDLLAGHGVVISSHHGPIAALERFLDSVSGETSIGSLDAADLLSSLADEVITGYQLVVEHLEQRIDGLDQLALHGKAGDDFLADLVAIRQRIGFVRRTLAPHRAALAALGRPDVGSGEGIGQAWPGLVERVEVTLASVEGLRVALLGTYDIHMSLASARADHVMKVLTLVSAVFLPAVVLAGVMGMNFEIPFFDEPSNYFLVVGVMVIFGILVLIFARWRSWL